MNTYALESRDTAINLVKNYSSTVACSINETSFKATKINNDYDSDFLVYWEGDQGCNGGRGTVNSIYNVVVNAAFGTQVVLPMVKQPEIDLICIDRMETKGDEIYLYGFSYGKGDLQSSPSTKTVYRIKYDSMKQELAVLGKSNNPNTTISKKCVSRVR